LRALEDVLATEHRAVAGYGIVGGRLSGPSLAAAQSAYAAHEARRDAVRRLVIDAGGRPAAPPPAYVPGRSVRTTEDAQRLAVTLEDACATAYLRFFAAILDRTSRATALGWLTDATTRAMRWRLAAGTVADAPPLPGLAAETTP
jgi:hypothetical protein